MIYFCLFPQFCINLLMCRSRFKETREGLFWLLYFYIYFLLQRPTRQRKGEQARLGFVTLTFFPFYPSGFPTIQNSWWTSGAKNYRGTKVSTTKQPLLGLVFETESDGNITSSFFEAWKYREISDGPCYLKE